MNHLVIIPTYNEAESIEKIIPEIFKLYNQINILTVDDSSPDGTAKLIEKLQIQYKNLYLLSQEKKQGLKKAYIEGMKWGLAHGFDVFSTCDADYSHNPKYIKDIIEYLNEGYEAIFGSRYIKNGNTRETDWFKNFISIGGNIYARFILGKKIYDWTEGFNTYTKSALEKINLDLITAKGFIMHAQMKYRAVNSNCKYKEFPIDFLKREKGCSKMDFNIIFEAFFCILKIKLGL